MKENNSGSMSYESRLNLTKSEKNFIFQLLEKFYNIKFSSTDKEEIIIINDLVEAVYVKKPIKNYETYLLVILSFLQSIHLLRVNNI